MSDAMYHLLNRGTTPKQPVTRKDLPKGQNQPQPPVADSIQIPVVGQKHKLDSTEAHPGGRQVRAKRGNLSLEPLLSADYESEDDKKSEEEEVCHDTPCLTLLGCSTHTRSDLTHC